MSTYKRTTYKAAKQAAEGVEQGVGDLAIQFEPTAAQRRSKANFWTAWQDDPTVDPDLMTADTAARMAGSRSLRTWWSEPGFKAWFLNKDEQRQRLEYLFELSMDAAEEILMNPDPKAQGARVQLIKHMSELADKMPSKSASLGKGLDGMVKAILSMGEVELKALLQKQGDKAGVYVSASSTAEQLPEKTLDIKEEV